MLGSILIGLDTPKHCTGLVELGIRWATQPRATLVGLGVVDEPGIRAVEPAFPVGGTPGVDPFFTWATRLGWLKFTVRSASCSTSLPRSVRRPGCPVRTSVRSGRQRR